MGLIGFTKLIDTSVTLWNNLKVTKGGQPLSAGSNFAGYVLMHTLQYIFEPGIRIDAMHASGGKQ